MGIIDWLIVAVLVAFTVQGFLKGLVATLVRICGGVATFLLIGQIYPLVKNSLIVNFKLGIIPASILAVILIIVVTAVVMRLLAWLLTRVVKAVKLSFMNKLTGLALGFANGLLVVIVCMVLLDYAPKLSTPLKDGSKHRVYAAVDTFKEDIFTQLKFNERDRFQQIRGALKKKEAARQNAE
jgi:uncharacterized membrane protein required for colicin V production